MTPDEDLRRSISKAFEVILGPTFPMAVGAPEFQKSLGGYAQLHAHQGGAAAFRARMVQAMKSLDQK